MSPGTYEDNEFDPNDFGGEVDYTPPKPKRSKNDPYPPPFSLVGVDLSKPPGFVGEVADWIDGQCRFPRRKLCIASALVTVGNIGGLRHRDSHDGVTANILAFCVAASATGKEAVQQAMADLHRVVGLQRAVLGGIKSEQEIVRNLIEHQPAYYIVDEIGIFLTKVRNAQNRGGAAYLEGVFGIVMSAYSKANSSYLLGGDVKRELRDMYAKRLARATDNDDEAGVASSQRMLGMIDHGLERPFLSMVGYTTPSTFDTIMDGEVASQGFVGRSIIVAEPDDNPQARKGMVKTPMHDLLERKLIQLRFGGSYDQTQDNGRIEWTGEEADVKTNPDAAEMLDKVVDWLHEYAGEMGEQTGPASTAMVRRSYEMVAKVSFVLAMQSGTRTAEHVRWAFAYVRQELDYKISLVFANDNGKERPDEAMAARIMGYLDTEKGTSIKVLMNRMKAKADALESVLKRMEKAGMVREQMGARKVAGKQITVWVKTD